MSSNLSGYKADKTPAPDSKPIKDCCGQSERGFHILLLKVVSSQGIKRFPYGGMEGMDEYVFDDGHQAVIHFQARLEWEGKLAYRPFRVIINGRNYQKVLRDISVGRRTILHPGKDEEDDEAPHISSITIKAGKLDDDELFDQA